MVGGNSNNKKTKWIIITGGVLSGLGKGVASASIGKLFSSNYKVIPIKCDGYLNVDPGTMNPIEHGEVFVLDDGGEVDMDFGHYERFLGVTTKFEWNLTMGKVFERIRDKERRGDYLGKTVQLIPHVTDMVKDWWKKIAREEEAEIILLEIGGTIGDIENEIYIEAARQLRHEVGRENIIYVHLTYIPKPWHVNEQKSKPTQQSVQLLREKGIIPNIIIPRCHEPLQDSIRRKISVFADVSPKNIIAGIDVDSVYQIPKVFSNQNIVERIDKAIGLNNVTEDSEWDSLVEVMLAKHDKTIKIGMCGKYNKLEDSYASVNEALKHSAAHFNVGVKIVWIDVEQSEEELNKSLSQVDGVIVPGGFGSRGIEGKILAAKYCRENNLPYLGLCYGLQMAVIEFARNVCKLKGAHSTEVDEKTKYPVVDILPEQKNITNKGGTMRLGAYPAVLKKNTLVYELCGGKEEISERHRHRYEVNPEYHKILEDNGLVFSGLSPNGTLVEFIENPECDYFVATQAHPELKSHLKKPAPLFYGLIREIVKRKE